jgi:DNA-nicking Smr family endonuclease
VRRLSAEEEALWAEVAATIRPLSREPLKPPVNAAEARPRPARRAPVRPAPAKIEQKQPAAPSGTLDSAWDRRLRSGSVEPDRVLDLHGHSLDQAWTAIDRGLEAAIRSGERVVLLVTGHARPGAPPVERGKIRAAVHDWLAVSRHAPRIAAVRGAHRRHGGGGSLYIILRRNRPGSTFS